MDLVETANGRVNGKEYPRIELFFPDTYLIFTPIVLVNDKDYDI
jgi:hypothetical protein